MTPSPVRAGRDVNDQIMGSTDLVETLSPGPHIPALSITTPDQWTVNVMQRGFLPRSLGL